MTRSKLTLTRREREIAITALRYLRDALELGGLMPHGQTEYLKLRKPTTPGEIRALEVELEGGREQD